MITRQIEVLERVSFVSGRKAAQLLFATQASTAFRLAWLRAISPFSPPMLSAQRSASIWSSTQSMEGVLMVSPLKMPSFSLPFLVMRNSLGSGQAGL